MAILPNKSLLALSDYLIGLICQKFFYFRYYMVSILVKDVWKMTAIFNLEILNFRVVTFKRFRNIR